MLLWLVIHLGVAGTRLRGRIVAWIGEARFRLAFSVASVLTLVLLVNAWGRADTTPLWHAPAWLRLVLAMAMLPAFVLFVALVSQPNPTMIGPANTSAPPPRGIQRITRHPM